MNGIGSEPTLYVFLTCIHQNVTLGDNKNIYQIIFNYMSPSKQDNEKCAFKQEINDNYNWNSSIKNVIMAH